MAAAFCFPDYFGHNVDALADCLWDVVRYKYGSDPGATGTVIALSRIDVFAARDPRLAWKLLDILAGAARSALLRRRG